MSIIDHTIHDHQGLKGEQNLAKGTTGTDAATLQTLPIFVANTAGVGSPLVLTAANANTHYTNTGAGAEAYFTLPAASTVGVNYKFIVTNAVGLRVVAVGTDTIQLDTITSAAAGYYESLTIGTSATIECVASGKWFVTSQLGTGAVT